MDIDVSDLVDEEEEETTEETTYRVQIRVAERPNDNSLWVDYHTYDDDGKSVVFETTDATELNDAIETLINNSDGKYRSKDIRPIIIHEWVVDAVSDVMENDLNTATEDDIESTVEDIFSGEDEDEETIATEEDIEDVVDDLFEDTTEEDTTDDTTDEETVATEDDIEDTVNSIFSNGE